MSYFTKFMRLPTNPTPFDPHQPKPRSRSLDVEALERSGIRMIATRVVNNI